jgi:hypothetical protein
MKQLNFTVRIIVIILFTTLTCKIFGNNSHSESVTQKRDIPGVSSHLADLTSSDTVIVTNLTDTVNGNITSNETLINDPGPDGISFREALYAANGTQGKKIILFHPSLIGDTITITPEGQSWKLTSGGITINGDINQDGNPDITLDGHLGPGRGPTGHGLIIVSSDITIESLNISEFAYNAIMVTCPDSTCGTKHFENLSFLNNTITSKRGSGIGISPLGIIDPKYSPELSDILWNNVLIKGNTLKTRNITMSLGASQGGGDRNKMSNILITENQIQTEGATVLEFYPSDTKSDYFGIPGPVDYSENNIVDSFLITKNQFIAPNGQGIAFGSPNWFNSNNKYQNIKIDSNNIIASLSWAGINFGGGNDPSDLEGTKIEFCSNIEISNNKIQGSNSSIALTNIGKNGGVRNVMISNNELVDYSYSGMYFISGESPAEDTLSIVNNILDSIIISGNNIHHNTNTGQGIGLIFMGGSNRPDPGPTKQNVISNIHLVDNLIENNAIGLQVYGGWGKDVENNRVDFEEIRGNVLINNIITTDIQNNMEGAKENEINGLLAQPPTFSPEPGIYNSPIDITLGSTTKNATIYYSLDGSDPNELSNNYTAPFHLDFSATIIARSYLDGWIPGNMVTVSYIINENTTSLDEFPIIDSCQLALYQNYPNPFTHETNIQFELQNASEIEINIFDLTGKEICTLLKEYQQPGQHTVRWNGTDNAGNRMKNGVYFYQMKTEQNILCRKLILVD